MKYDEEILKKVKSFGVLQYDLEKIISILQPSNIRQFSDDFKNPESPVFIMYQAGFSAGQYRLDAQHFKMAETENELKKIEYGEIKKRLELRKTLFGI